MLRRSLIFLHRWLGVVLCLFFFVWFVSGIGMMYFAMPSVGAAERLEHGVVLEASAVAISPAEAAEKLGGGGGQLRLARFDGRPAYRAFGRRGSSILYADTGEAQGDFTRELVDRAAARWTGKLVEAATVTEVTEVDQWTLQVRLGALAPVWKYSWPGGEQVYVSQATGEVVQHTTKASRLAAYLGPVTHWLYFTPLRKHGLAWTRVVVWSSGIGTIAAILGVVVGAWAYSPSRRYRHAGAPTSIPFRGQKRWHTILGLIFGIAVITYTFSGLLSMDPFPWLGGGESQRGAEPDIVGALRGGRVEPSAFAAKPPRVALEQLAGWPVKELELTSFAGRPFYLAHGADGATRVVPMDGPPQPAFDENEILRLVATAAGGEARTQILTQYDRYYLDRTRSRPLPVILAQVASTGTRYYIDPKTARVVQAYNSSQWIGRWLYNGLHSLNFPWLYNYRPLWDVVVLALMLGGASLCVTSFVLAWRVLGRKLARRPDRSTDDGGKPAAV